MLAGHVTDCSFVQPRHISRVMLVTDSGIFNEVRPLYLNDWSIVLTDDGIVKLLKLSHPWIISPPIYSSLESVGNVTSLRLVQP